MGYLEDFRLFLQEGQYARFLRLWEEYCQADTVDGKELLIILRMIKNSSVAAVFGDYAESILPLWQKIEDPSADNVLKTAVDLQTTNSAIFADLSLEYLTKRYSTHKHFNDLLRIVGLRARHKFQGAISNFELLLHMEKEKFVFHSGGWGAGEVMEMSLLREHVLIEFEGISTPKDLSFESAFKSLIPLSADHFLSRRFGSPDALEKEGREDPLKLIHMVLRDLGPKTAAEIKTELCDLVIPEEDWVKWWQLARSKIKKDTLVKIPSSARECFELREEELTHNDSFLAKLKASKDVFALIESIYECCRDFPQVFKDPSVKKAIEEPLEEAFKEKHSPQELADAIKVQLSFLKEDIFEIPFPLDLLKSITYIEGVFNRIDVIAFKKRFLTLIRSHHSDWAVVFLHLLFLTQQNLTREYLFKELSQEASLKDILREKLKDLVNKVSLYPEAFFWYFQKATGEQDVPLSDKESKRELLEAFFILLHYIEQNSAQRDLVKKMQQLLSSKRYLLVRDIMQGASVEYLQELLLVASKCQSLSKQDQRILRSLAEVAEPSLGKKIGVLDEETLTIWTTAEGYKKVQERIHHLGTIETVDNAREIEAARALGDLRENSEYKFALERRSRLQSELKTLSHQVQGARILTKEDISTQEVTVGSIVDLIDSKGNKVTYTLLGPWDADPDKHILSFQSKLAQAMLGHKESDSFSFQGETFHIKKIRSYLE